MHGWPPAKAVLALSLLAASVISACSGGGSGLRTCGSAPSTSPETPTSLVLTVSAPRSAAAGTLIYPKITIHVRGTASTRAYGFGGGPVTYVVKDGQIVGKFAGFIAGTGMGLEIGNRPVELSGGAVLLSGCARDAVEPVDADATRKPLPPGTYQLVASINLMKNRGQAVLASRPVPIIVT